MNTFIQDIRFAIRLLMKNRGFTLVAVLTLAVGIGANTAIFSLINTVLLRQLPFKDPDQLVWIWSKRTDRDKSTFSLPDFMDYKNQNRTLEQISGFSTWSANLLNAGEPERLFGVRSSSNIFQLLGVNAEIGRTLIEEDDNPGNQRVVVLSHGFWSRRFGMNPEIIGKTLTLSDENYIVAGVLPSTFAFPGMEADIVIPLVPETDPFRNERASISFLRVIARVKKGMTSKQAESDLNAIAHQLRKLYPVANASKEGVKIIALKEELVGSFRIVFFILSAAVGLVLLIACVNLANLVLARVSTRYREMAIRLAIGATRMRLIRQLFTENILLSLAGGFFGLLLAQPAMKAMLALYPTSIPRAGEIEIDIAVLLFSLFISLLSGALFGFIPTLHIVRENATDELKGSAKGTSAGSSKNNVRSLLILTEVAMSVLLLIGAGLLAKSFLQLQSVSPGFHMQNLLVMRLSLPKTQYSTTELVTTFSDQLAGRIRNLPGVVSIAATSPLPLSGANVRVNFNIVGRPPLLLSEQPITQYRMTGPNYFQTMKIPIHSGRDFAKTDLLSSQPVAIINSTFARRYWTNESPIGAHIKIDDNNQGPREVQIVAVVGDVKHTGLHEDPMPETYVPISQIPEENVSLLTNNMSWVIRTAAEPLMLAEAVRREIRSTDPSVATSNVKSMEQYLSLSLAPRRFNLYLLGIAAFAALTLASMGIYALISYSVAQRTQELGIRMTLGAQQNDLFRLVVGSGLKIVFAGIVLGIIGAFALTRVLSNLIYGISVTDPLTFVVMPLLLMVIAFFACYIPARQIGKLDPVNALRLE